MKAKLRALDYVSVLCELRDRGETTHGIALQLTAMGIETPNQRSVWSDRTVKKIFEYAGERKPTPWVSYRSSADRRRLHADLPSVKPFYTLSEFHDASDYSQPLTDDERGWVADLPVGRELL